MKDKNKSDIVISIEKKVLKMLDENTELIDIDISGGKEKKVTLYLYNKNETNLDKLEKISKLIYPELEKDKYFSNGFTLEISSPGIFRKIKYIEEFNIFKGREIKIILNNGTILQGICEGIVNNTLSVKIENKIMKININDIKKSQLNG